MFAKYPAISAPAAYECSVCSWLVSVFQSVCKAPREQPWPAILRRYGDGVPVVLPQLFAVNSGATVLVQLNSDKCTGMLTQYACGEMVLIGILKPIFGFAFSSS